MRITFTAAVCVAALAAGAARAQETPQPTGTPGVSPAQTPQTASPEAPAFALDKLGPIAIAYNIGVANDYSFRGISQTNGNAQLSAGIDASYKQFYAGVWQSNVNFKPFGDRDTSNEIDVYGGFKPTFATVSFDVGVIYYAYANQPDYLPNVDYVEGYIKGTKAFGPVTLGASLFYSPDFTGETGDAEYYEGNAAWAVTKKLSLSGAVGRQEIQKSTADYTTWNIGATYALTDHFALDLRYWDTDEHRFGSVYGSRVIAGLKATF